jgi:hypothetical protein
LFTLVAPDAREKCVAEYSAKRALRSSTRPSPGRRRSPPHKLVNELAAKHGVGFFDVSAQNGDVWFPTAEKLERFKK